MKKTLILIAGLLIAASLSWAARAPETPYRYTQPDGTVITLVLHGDEFHHWTTWNGKLVEMDEQGFYRPASRMVFDSRASAARELRRQANAQRTSSLAWSDRAIGEKHYLVLLIEFDDLSFSVPDARNAFDRMLNQPGYHENLGTGSVRDYYIDNSNGLFKPTFDVFGPVKVSRGYAYYGEGLFTNVDDLLREACVLLDDSLDFSQYDTDKDGVIDNIFFYFAGYNKAEGGPSNSIWPHQSASPIGEFDGIRIDGYACSSELRGNSGTTMAAIGLFVHEFAHTLGVPDFYDTANDKALNPEDFSVMSSGNYMNDQHTPVCFNSMEKQMLGWFGEFPSLSEAGGYELQSVGSQHLPWVLPADVDGERFILEMRDGQGWDAYLPTGLVIYHMDASDNSIGWNNTAASLWNGLVSASINGYIDHPCFYVVASKEYGRGLNDSMIFPGSGNVTEFTPKPWSGMALPTRITDIRVAGDRVRFNLTASVRRMIRGWVKDTEGHPLEGATVTLSVPARASAPGRMLFRSQPAAADVRYTATTASDGSYEIALGPADETPVFLVSASKPGYIEQARKQEVSLYGNCSFLLRAVGSISRAGLMKYDPDNPNSFSTMGSGDDSDRRMMAACYYKAEELAPYAGMKVRSLTFSAQVEQYRSLHALVSEGTGKPWTFPVKGSGDNGSFTVDLSDADIQITGGKGMYFGYAVDGDDPMPIVYQKRNGVDDAMYYADYDLDNPSWYFEPGCALVVSVTLYDPSASQYISLSSMGFSSIDNPRWQEGYAAGDMFAFRLIPGKGKEVESIEWLYDGAKTTSPSVKLSAGKHVVAALVRYRGGSQENLSLELDVR